MALLTLVKAAKFYGQKLVFKDVSLELEAGSILLLAGPNGAGKSTLLKLMAGLARPSAGSVELRIPLERLGFLGHQSFLYPDLTGLENLRFWTRLYGRDADEAALNAALERVEMSFAAHERAGRYSRGMLQRLSLARVFLLEPSLLLLDEPATGLDRASNAILHREILAARERGAAMVWVSHSLGQDLPLADRVLEIRKNRPAYLGPAADYQPEAVC